MITSTMMLLESSINHCIKNDLQTLARLQELNGKHIKLEIEDWNIAFYILPQHNGIQLRQKIHQEPDTTIQATLKSLVMISLAEDKQQAVKNNKIKFQGDVHIGITMQQILSKLDIDWEDHLAQIVGDTPATLIIKGFSRALGMSKTILNTLQSNIKEYVHHEAKLSPTKKELETFYDDVSRLRHDVDRLEAKLHLLQRANTHD